jgi:hypothetical protein
MSADQKQKSDDSLSKSLQFIDAIIGSVNKLIEQNPQASAKDVLDALMVSRKMFVKMVAVIDEVAEEESKKMSEGLTTGV